MTEEEKDKLEIRKVKALEKIGNSVDALAIWFEEIDKTEWSERIQYYLFEFHRMKNLETELLEEPVKESVKEPVKSQIESVKQDKKIKK